MASSPVCAQGPVSVFPLTPKALVSGQLGFTALICLTPPSPDRSHKGLLSLFPDEPEELAASQDIPKAREAVRDCDVWQNPQMFQDRKPV